MVKSQTGKCISSVVIKSHDKSFIKKQFIYFRMTINFSEMEAVKPLILKSVWKTFKSLEIFG